MKLKFILLSFLLLFARSCDFYSTSLWFFQENGINDETNPLTSLLGLGWNGLIISNILLVGGIIGLYYYYCFKYKSPQVLNVTPQNYRQYASVLYFGEPDKFFQVFYKMPKNLEVIGSHMGYVLVRVLIIASFLASFHNICQYYGFDFYDSFRSFVKSPLFVIYALIVGSIIFFYVQLLKKEFKTYLHINKTK